MDASAPLPEEIQAIPLGTDGLLGWKIATPLCRALISQQGAQVLEFQALGRKPLLWLSEQAGYRPGKAIRGGIPLCFPWFGPHPQDAGKPAHGFARLRDWRLVHTEKPGETLLLHFRLGADEQTRRLWPHDFEARLSIALGRFLQLQLEVENTGTTAFAFTFAFHSYFPVNDIRAAHVDGLDGTPRIDQLDPQRRRHTQQGPLRFAGETDQIHLHAGGEYRLVDAAGGQALRISAPACRSVIVWNPGQAKAARLADMAPGAWRHMVCVECGNVEADLVALPPGSARRFSLLLEYGG
ncbi:MAG: D-hexose-6-phosphate mutarotase [Pseudomonadota bacterium]